MPETPRMHPDHQITVTPGPFGRAWFDCTCRPLINSIFPSKSAAVQAGLRHLHETAGCTCAPDVRNSDVHPNPDPEPSASVAVTTK